MLTVHPLDRPAAPLPLDDVYNSTTLIPFLENLYDEFYQDEDAIGTYGMDSDTSKCQDMDKDPIKGWRLSNCMRRSGIGALAVQAE